MDDVPGSAGLGAKVGWFFAVVSESTAEQRIQEEYMLIVSKDVILMLFGIFLIPELKGRSLEETDELFDAGLMWGWQFPSYKTSGAGARLAALERDDTMTADKQSSTSVELAEHAGS